jgi:fibronectin-binding autotransporter adhesin
MVAAPVESRNLWAALILVLCAAPVGAQTTYTWSGGGDANWSTAANWGGTAPTSDLDNTLLVLAGSTQLTNTLDFDLSAKSLTFGTGAGAFVVGGSNTLTLDSGGITIANHNNQTFNAKLALSAAQTWANNGIGTFTVGGAVDNRGSLLAIGGDIIGAGPTVFNGVISGSGGLSKTGAGHGRVVLSGTNTYTGVTMISGGTLQTNLLADGGSNSGIGASSNVAANLVLNGGTLRYTGVRSRPTGCSRSTRPAAPSTSPAAARLTSRTPGASPSAARAPAPSP